jgi:hypothetical protein
MVQHGKKISFDDKMIGIIRKSTLKLACDRPFPSPLPWRASFTGYLEASNLAEFFVTFATWPGPAKSLLHTTAFKLLS